MMRVALCLSVIFLAATAVEGAQLQACHGIDGQVQECEDFTYAGSLVEALPPSPALEEALLVAEEVKSLPLPGAVLEGCDEAITRWFGHVADFYRTGMYDASLLIPAQNHIMMHHEEIAQSCPVAWLVTLLMKIESNLERGQQGLPCARVHAAGCLRDARGYWRLYANARSQLPRPAPMAGGQEKHVDVAEVLPTGEARVVAKFRQLLRPAEEL